jgi:hypothetical protein
VSPPQFEIAVDLNQDQQFWIVLSNNHPSGTGTSRFRILELSGSADPTLTLSRRSVAPAGSVALWCRERLSSAADAVGRWIASLLGQRLLYRVARTSPEYQSVEAALQRADEQLQRLAPLQYLSGFSDFLRASRPDNLHVNGCGDFQLMARDDWNELRGYPEFETFSMNIDGLFSYVADAAGIREQVLPMPIYHLEHEVGSGWSPEGEALLRKRIAERGITWVDASTVYIWAAYMRWLGRPMIFNGPDWGMANAQLPERTPSASCDITS